MNKVISNPCMRCGKERVVVKKWKEKSGDSVIMVTESSCPDAECQKKVEFENKRQRDKTASMRLKSKQRAIERSAERAAKKTGKKPKRSVL